MISQNEFITMSLDLNLFFLRIMKEHSFFLEIGFTPKDRRMKENAGMFRRRFEQLLSEATTLANGNVSENAVSSRQITTQYTLEAERLYKILHRNTVQPGSDEARGDAAARRFRMSGARMEDAVESLNRRGTS